MSRLIDLAGRIVRDKRQYRFFRAWGTGAVPGAAADPAIQVYSTYEEVPARFRDIVFPSPLTNSLYFRLKRGCATLMCYSEDGRRLQAYSWIQSWKPFRRRFHAVTGDAGVPPGAREPVMSGPSWTSPADRGKGICAAMLRRKLELCDKDAPVLTHTLPGNVPPQKAALKAGFEPIGCWEITVWLRLFARSRKLAGPDPS